MEAMLERTGSGRGHRDFEGMGGMRGMGGMGGMGAMGGMRGMGFGHGRH